MPRFRIHYVEPNLPGEVWRVAEVEFEDWTGRAKTHTGEPIGDELHITARQWAEDAGYTLADKGEFRVEEI